MKTSSQGPARLLNILWVLGNLFLIAAAVGVAMTSFLMPIPSLILWKLLAASAASQLALTFMHYLKRK